MSYFISFFLFLILNINIKLSSLNIISQIQSNDICYKSNSSEIPKNNYSDYQPSNPDKGNEEDLLSMIFLNEEGNSKYFKRHIAKYDKINIFFYLLLVISFIIFIDFSVHFFCKLHKKKSKKKKS